MKFVRALNQPLIIDASITIVITIYVVIIDLINLLVGLTPNE